MGSALKIRLSELLEQASKEDLKEALVEKTIQVKELTEQVIELSNKTSELVPKAEYYDAVTKASTEYLMRDVAKQLNFKNMGQNKLFKYLRKKSILNRDNMPYQSPHVDVGRFSYKQNKWVNKQTGELNTTKTPVVTNIGMDYIRKLLLSDGYEYNDR